MCIAGCYFLFGGPAGNTTTKSLVAIAFCGIIQACVLGQIQISVWKSWICYSGNAPNVADSMITANPTNRTADIYPSDQKNGKAAAKNVQKFVHHINLSLGF